MNSDQANASTLADLSNIDSDRFWYALGGRVSGAAVIATADDKRRAGFFALSATHLAQDPPTVMVTIGKSTAACTVVRRSGRFSVNYLAQGHESLVNVFSGQAGLDGDRRFTAGAWFTMRSGAPALTGAAGILDCVLIETIERYDVVIAIGRIVDFAIDKAAAPLVFHRGKIRPFSC